MSTWDFAKPQWMKWPAQLQGDKWLAFSFSCLVSTVYRWLKSFSPSKVTIRKWSLPSTLRICRSSQVAAALFGFQSCPWAASIARRTVLQNRAACGISWHLIQWDSMRIEWCIMGYRSSQWCQRCCVFLLVPGTAWWDPALANVSVQIWVISWRTVNCKNCLLESTGTHQANYPTKGRVTWDDMWEMHWINLYVFIWIHLL